MEDSGTRHLGQRSCPLPFGYDTYQSSTRYPQDTANQARSYLPMTASQVTSDGQRNYSYNYEQQPQYPSTPQIQDSSRQYDTGCPQINQRQIQRPAYSSGWIYNITVPAQPTQTPVGFESPQGYESRRSTTVIEPLPGNFGVPHQSYNASSDPSTAQLSTLTDYSTAQYPHQNQLSFQQITGVDSSTSSVQPRSASIYQPTTVEDYQLLLAMSNAAEDNCIVHPVVYEEDRNFQTFKTLLISIYRSIQEGNLSEAGQNLSTFTSEWFSDTLEEFGE